MEIRYDQWRQFNKTWYPMRVEIYQNGMLMREIKVDQVRVNPVFSKDLFDIGYLKSTYPPAPAKDPETPESKGIGEVEETIERFRKIFE